MAIAGSEGGEALSLEDMTAEPPRPSASGSGVLHHLRAAWAMYVADNERDWARLAEEQAKNPTLE